MGEIVASIVRQAIGLERTRCRPVICANTEPVEAMMLIEKTGKELHCGSLADGVGGSPDFLACH